MYNSDVLPPRVLEIEGQLWHRFMDKIFCPAPVAELSAQLVSELCELRLALADSLIDRSVHHGVVSVANFPGISRLHYRSK